MGLVEKKLGQFNNTSLANTARMRSNWLMGKSQAYTDVPCMRPSGTGIWRGPLYIIHVIAVEWEEGNYTPSPRPHCRGTVCFSSQQMVIFLLSEKADRRLDDFTQEAYLGIQMTKDPY